ncbi:hemolysin family protein [Enemella evansiae]|uniref:hemolysin family protein n=1 Tax=Enemella evansiae TaxID=2016499 RepID=UPI001E5693C7|nr:hemolysin family protein [Enemella evansiae]
MATAWLLLALVIVLIALCGFFVMAEFALVTVDRPAVRRAAEQGDRRAESVQRALGTLSTQLSGCQLGITITSLVIGLIAEPSVAELLRPVLHGLGLGEGVATPISFGLAFVLATLAQMVFSELVPKNWALAEPLRLARWIATPQLAFVAVTRPLLRFFNGTANAVVRLFGVTPSEELASGHSPQELSALAYRSAREGTLHPALAEHMQQTAELGQRFAADAMTPRARADFLDATVPVNRLLAAARRTGHSRFPVIGEDADDVIGAAHFRDALAVPAEDRDRVRLGEIVRTVPAVPASMPLDNVLGQLRGGLQLAIVIDEYGGTDGIITLEDLMEELVGEITDEQDRPQDQITELGPGHWVLSGLVRPDEVRRLIGLELPEGLASETLGGLITERLERFSQVGDTVEATGRDHAHPDADGISPEVPVLLTVRRLDGRRVAEAELEVLPDPEDADE